MIELVIGLTMGAIVLGALVAILGTALVENRRQRAHSELQRDAEFVVQLLTQEIRQAGLGVPTGAHVDPAFGTGAPSTFDARRILVAGATDMLIMGDLPRPDANYPAFGTLHDRANGALNRISWHTENNGTCVPGTCVIGDASVFFPGGGDCDSATARTCPWYGRLGSGDRIQVVEGSGQWAHSAMSTLAPTVSNGVVSAQLSVGLDGTGRWVNAVHGDAPTGTYGQGWVTSIDRVRYRYDAGTNTLRRTQCLGDPDPEHGNWPDATASTVPASLSVDPTGTAPTSCTAEEIMARNVSSVAFRYLTGAGVDQAGAATANAKNLIRRVEWTIEFSKVDATLGRPVAYTAVGSVNVQNVQQGEP